MWPQCFSARVARFVSLDNASLANSNDHGGSAVIRFQWQSDTELLVGQYPAGEVVGGLKSLWADPIDLSCAKEEELRAHSHGGRSALIWEESSFHSEEEGRRRTRGR